MRGISFRIVTLRSNIGVLQPGGVGGGWHRFEAMIDTFYI